MRELEDEEHRAQREYRIAAEKSHSASEDLLKAEKTAESDSVILQTETEKLSNVSSEVSVVDKGIDILRAHIEKQTELEARAKASLRNAEQSRDTATNALLAANATLTHAITTEIEAKKTLLDKTSALAQLKNDSKTSIELIKKNKGSIIVLDTTISLKREMHKKLAEEVKAVNDRLENERRMHTEALADVAQITRRLDEKLQQLEDAQTSVKVNEAAVKDLEEKIKESLDDRALLNKQLDDENKVRNDFTSKIQSLRVDLDQLKCNA